MSRVYFRVHAVERMFERGIPFCEVQKALGAGEPIEEYPDSTGFGARLFLSGKGRRALHLVVAEHAESHSRVVVTGYRPEPARWSEDFRRRRDELPDM